jgi:glutathione S-transferase
VLTFTQAEAVERVCQLALVTLAAVYASLPSAPINDKARLQMRETLEFAQKELGPLFPKKAQQTLFQSDAEQAQAEEAKWMRAGLILARLSPEGREVFAGLVEQLLALESKEASS